MPTRRALTLAAIALPLASRSPASTSTSTALLSWPRDFGAHPASSVEWWYLTGALASGPPTGTARWGFQITFFRALTGLEATGSAVAGSGIPISNATASSGGSRFAATELVFAHAAVTDIAGRRLVHDQRIARSGFGIATASTDDTAVTLRDWRLDRSGGTGASRYRAHAASETAGFTFDLQLDATQPVLLQGAAGLSQKGPRAENTSRYYSEPQLAVRGTLQLGGSVPLEVTGRAWLDHEWSDALLDPSAVGWDWIGMNLDDGAALTAFRLRRADGSALWAGGSYRPAGEATRNFEAAEITFVAGRSWRSPASKALYPVEWTIATPAGRFMVKALLDDQELDSRASTGSIYWEGLSALFDADGRELGHGYLEMTGYAGRLRL